MQEMVRSIVNERETSKILITSELSQTTLNITSLSSNSIQFISKFLTLYNRIQFIKTNRFIAYSIGSCSMDVISIVDNNWLNKWLEYNTSLAVSYTNHDVPLWLKTCQIPKIIRPHLFNIHTMHLVIDLSDMDMKTYALFQDKSYKKIELLQSYIPAMLKNLFKSTCIKYLDVSYMSYKTFLPRVNPIKQHCDTNPMITNNFSYLKTIIFRRFKLSQLLHSLIIFLFITVYFIWNMLDLIV